MAATAAEKRSIGVVRDFNDHIFNDRQYDRIGEYQSEDYVQHGPFPDGEVYGNDESLETLQLFHSAFSDVHAEVVFRFGDGEYVCTRYHYTGTHDGPLMEIAPTDVECEVPGTVVNRIEDGKIAEAWVSLDLMGLLQQVGVVPEMAEISA